MDIATLPDSQPIAGMRRFRDPARDVVFDYLLGNGPLVLSAPHAGWRTYEPAGVNAFGGRERNDPGDEPTALNRGSSMGPGGFNDSGGDYGTRYITFGIARYLVSRGVRPHVIMARQRRNVVDLNRPWGFQHHWELDPPGTNLPNLITTPDGIDPEFLRTYYLAYHQVLLSMVRRVARGPEGWLFDIHGEGGNESFRLATYGGITARADALYDGPQCLRALVAAAGLSVTPNTVATEAGGFSYIAGFLHGATLPSRLGAATDPPVPPPGRLHGVHVEIARSYRLPPGATDYNYMNHITTADIDWLEAIGAQFGEGLYGFLNACGLV